MRRADRLFQILLYLRKRKLSTTARELAEALEVSERTVYRDMRDPESGRLSEFGDSSKYVIVTFQFGKAIGVTSNDLEFCRSTFAPRPPGAGFFNPGTVHPLPHCPGVEGQNGVEPDSYGSSELK